MEQIKEYSVSGLCSCDSYAIPIYQRNYAWGEAEIVQMIQDIWDFSKKNGRQSGCKNYYIGSLVVFARKKEGLYEIIDGQQRYTTLLVLLSALKHKFKCKLDFNSVNLDFDSRRLSGVTLKCLFEDRELDEMESSMTEAYQICYKAIRNLVSAPNSFCKYLLNNVKIIRVVVPPDTELNHYFEIMNNRGEQLEKHEILKARFMDELEDLSEQITFGKIWDACSDMNRHVQLGFLPKERKLIFGEDLNTLLDDFPTVQARIGNLPQTGIRKVALRLLVKDLLPEDFRNDNTKSVKRATEDRYHSIINFPNFRFPELAGN